MPELTVSMPAFNAQKYIAEAIKSVLCQDGIDFELLVVDDGSDDKTTEIVRSFGDPRVRSIRNNQHMGVAYCHDFVIQRSTAPFIAHVHSDGIVLPGAFQKMIDKLKTSSRLGLVHCYSFDIDEDGKITRDAFRERRRHVVETSKQCGNDTWGLFLQGFILRPLRLYRREVIDALGGCNDALKYRETYEIDSRIANKYEIGLVPEFLYCCRIHQNDTSKALRLTPLLFWYERLDLCRQSLKHKSIFFLKERNHTINKPMLVSLLHAFGLTSVQKCLRALLSMPERIRRFMTARLISPVLHCIYDQMTNHFSWWPIDILPYSKKGQSTTEKRVAYYLWHFPVLSQSFVQREIVALRRCGVAVDVVADGYQDIGLLDHNAKTLIKNTHYLLPQDERVLARYRRYFFRRHPLLYLNLFLYVIFHEYGKYKKFREDVHVFAKAVYLAGKLKDMNINHVHSPWADRCAFISLIASRLARVRYSVEARAHDIHRKTQAYALAEKFENAQFVITNTRYNESHIKSLLHECHWQKVTTIHNGIDLEQFIPNVEKGKIPIEIGIVSVARLVEQKGLVYLLKACRILKDKEYSFKCEVIGAAQESGSIWYYIELKRLRRKLGLEDCVTFSGAQPFQYVLKKYRSSDIFVLPCVIAEDGSRDITPNSLIEAMAMKLPVICTNITGIAEIVDDGVSGILVPPNDEDALSKALMKVIGDYELREALGENARRKIKEKFDIEKNILQFVRVFESKKE